MSGLEVAKSHKLPIESSGYAGTWTWGTSGEGRTDLWPVKTALMNSRLTLSCRGRKT